MVLTLILAIGGGLLLLAGVVWAWRNRPYAGSEEEMARRDEAALQADAFVNRSAQM